VLSQTVYRDQEEGSLLVEQKSCNHAMKKEKKEIAKEESSKWPHRQLGKKNTRHEKAESLYRRKEPT